MSKTKAGITAGAVLLSAALAVILFNSWLTTQSYGRAIKPVASSQAPTTTASQSDQVWTYNCELPVQRPEEILLTCADGGMMLDRITWTSWGKSGATGQAFYRENDCTPDCATGMFSTTSVTVQLGDPIEYKGKFFLKTLEITPIVRQQLQK